MVGDHRADRVALAVVRLLAEQDEVGLLLLQDLGERVAGGAHVRVGQRLVGQVDRAVGAERDGLVQRTHGALRAHGDRHDLLDIRLAALLDLHGGLDRVGVEGIEVLLTGAVEALRARVHAFLDGGVRHLFHEDADLQVLAPSGSMRRRILLTARTVD